MNVTNTSRMGCCGRSETISDAIKRKSRKCGFYVTMMVLMFVLMMVPILVLMMVCTGTNSVFTSALMRGCQHQWLMRGVYTPSVINLMAATISSSEQSAQVPRAGMARIPSMACLVKISIPWAKRGFQAASPFFGASKAPVP